MRWTEEDKRRAFEERASGKKLREIAELFPGRSVHHVGNLLNPGRRSQTVALGEVTIQMLATLGHGERPPTYLIEEAILRAAHPRTTTMQFCGDPVLNQCAAFGIGRRL
jgi:hypothetical protein